MECTNYDTPDVRRGIIKKAMVVLSFLSIAFIVTIDIFLPQLIEYYEGVTDQVLGNPLLIFLWLSSLPLIVMLVFFLCISLNLNKKGVFSSKVLRYLRGIQISLLVEFLFFLYASIYYKRITPVVILFGILILFVLATLFWEIVKDGEQYYKDSTFSV